MVSAPRAGSASERVFLVLPAQREGLAINDDWDAFGQRQTDATGGAGQHHQGAVEICMGHRRSSLRSRL